MIKFLILWIVAYFAYGLSFQDACLSQCRRGCFVDSLNKRCKFCPVGCNKCRDSDTCITCASGYYLNRQKNCVSCSVAGCKQCTKSGVCTQCKSGFYRINSSSCVSCGSSCKTCASSTTCKTCRNGSSLVGQYSFNPFYFSAPTTAATGTCQSCPYGCKICEIPESCSNCHSGYTLSNFQCISCSEIDKNCVSCDESVTRCTACNTGNYLLGNKCLPCGAGCAKCLSFSTCQKCNEKYFLNANKGCSPCIPFCMSCQNGTTCSQCELGYVFDSEKGECAYCNLDCGIWIVSVFPLSGATFSRDPLLAKTALLTKGEIPPTKDENKVVANPDEDD